MSWAINSTGAYELTLGAPADTLWLSDEEWPGQAEVRLLSDEYAAGVTDNLLVVLFSSRDGRTRWEAGIDGTDVVIRKVVNSTDTEVSVKINYAGAAVFNDDPAEDVLESGAGTDRTRVVGRQTKELNADVGTNIGSFLAKLGAVPPNWTHTGTWPFNATSTLTGVTSGNTAVVQSMAHGLAANQPFVLNVRYVDTRIEVFVNDDFANPIMYQDLDGDALLDNRHFGFVSNQTTTKVVEAQVYRLTPQYSGRTDVLVAVCDGNVWVSLDGQSITRIGTGGFSPLVPVSLAEYDNSVFGVDGKNATEIRLDTLDIVDWGGTTAAEALPGASPEPGNPAAFLPGTTTAVVVSRHLDRLVLGYDNQIVWSAAGDPRDFNVGDIDEGRATSIPVGTEPVVAIVESTKGALVVCSRNQMWEVIGSPTYAAVQANVMQQNHGASTLNAVHPIEDGTVAIHSAEGVFVASPTGGGSANITQNSLQAIEVPRPNVDDYWVTVVKDPIRHHVYFFITPDDETVTSQHFAYSEQVGQWQRDAGGWFPESYPTSAGPTVAGSYQGRVIVGARDGWLYEFTDNPSLTMDFGTDKVNTQLSCALMDDGDLTEDTILNEVAIVPTTASGAITYEVYRGGTPQRAYLGPNRQLAFAGLIRTEDAGRPIRRKARAPALVLDLKSTDGSIIGLEAVDVRTEPRTKRFGRLRSDTGEIIDDPTEESMPGVPSGTGPGTETTAGCQSCVAWVIARKALLSTPTCPVQVLTGGPPNLSVSDDDECVSETSPRALVNGLYQAVYIGAGHLSRVLSTASTPDVYDVMKAAFGSGKFLEKYLINAPPVCGTENVTENEVMFWLTVNPAVDTGQVPPPFPYATNLATLDAGGVRAYPQATIDYALANPRTSSLDEDLEKYLVEVWFACEIQ